MRYRTLGNSGCAVSELCLGTMTFGNETDEDGRARPARPVRRGRRHPRRHRRRLHGRRLGGDHRPLARRPPRRRDRPGRPGDQGPVPDRARCPNAGGSSARHLTRALDASLARLGDRLRGPLPGARLGPVDAAGGDAADARRLRPLGQDPLLRLLELHRLAADQGGPPRPRARAGRAGHAAAAVQPDRARDRVGDRPGRARRRAGPAARGARSAAAGSAASTSATSAPPARPGSARTPGAAWRRGSGAAPSAPGTSSRPSSGSPRPAAPRWRPWPWPGSPTGPA